MPLTKTPQATNIGYLISCSDEEAAYMYRSCLANVKAARKELEGRGFMVLLDRVLPGEYPTTSIKKTVKTVTSI